jgi:hypothetical protein
MQVETAPAQSWLWQPRFFTQERGNVGYAHFLSNLTFLVPLGDHGAAVAMMLVKNDGRSAKRANTNTSVANSAMILNFTGWPLWAIAPARGWAGAAAGSAPLWSLSCPGVMCRTAACLRGQATGRFALVTGAGPSDSSSRLAAI